MNSADKKKKANKYAVRIFNLLLICFVVLYFSKSSGYYEFAEHKQVELNEEQIKKFESDVEQGKNVNLSDYIEERNVTYNNIASDIGYGISDQISKIVTNGMDGTFDFLEQMFKG